MRSAVALFVLAAFITVVSCNHGDGPFYLKKCFQADTGEVILKIQVPTNYDGVLTVEGVPSLTQVITEPGLYNLGFLDPGEYQFCLELIENDVPRSRYWFNISGTTECCTLTVIGDPVDPPEPPDPPDPLLNIHVDGCTLVFENVDPECPLSLTFGLVWEEIAEDTVISFLDLSPGPYDVKVFDCENNIVFEDEIVIGEECSDCDDEVKPPFPIPPKWGKHKVLVCIKGRKQKFLPWPAACNLIKKGKATLGPCRKCQPKGHHNHEGDDD